MNELIIRIILFVISFGILAYLIYRNKKPARIDVQLPSLGSVNYSRLLFSPEMEKFLNKWKKEVDKLSKKRRNNVSKKRKIRTNKTKKTRVRKS
jgi:hypothetical protein